MKVIINGIYKHYKGDLYLVIDIATHSETHEKMIIYRGLYEDSPLWVRPYDSFVAKLNKETHPNIDQTYRFELQNIKSKRTNH